MVGKAERVLVNPQPGDCLAGGPSVFRLLQISSRATAAPGPPVHGSNENSVEALQRILYVA